MGVKNVQNSGGASHEKKNALNSPGRKKTKQKPPRLETSVCGLEKYQDYDGGGPCFSGRRKKKGGQVGKKEIKFCSTEPLKREGREKKKKVLRPDELG